MTECDYNLLDEEWIPVLLTDGGVEKVGILKAFERAYDIEDLACELPTQKIAIQRVLLAICYRVVSLEDEEDWGDLWRAGLPMEAIRVYLEKWRDRFYLFGGRHPFMQAPDLRTPKGAVSGLERIVADVPNGERQLFTTRHGRALKRITPAEAAVWVIHTQAYDPAGIRSGAVGDDGMKKGKGYSIGPAWCGQTGAVWLRGDNLEETLMLNLVVADTVCLQGPSPQSDEAACTWESEAVETAVRRDYSRDGKPDPNGIGIPRLLTWHSRRMRLHGDRDGVTGVVLAQGDKLGPQNMQRFEPMSLWRYSQPQSKKFKEHIYMPAKHEPGRAFWRNLPSTLPVTEKIPGFDKSEQQKFQQSATLLFQAYLKTLELDFPARIRLEAVGMTYGEREASIKDLYHDQMTLAKVLLEEEGKALAYSVKQQVLTVEEVAKAVGILGANLSRAAGESGDGAGEGAQKRAKERFFAQIDDPFRSWLASLDGNSDVENKQREWTETARRIAKQVAGELIASAPRSATTGRNTGKTYMSSGIAENFFNKELNKTLPPTNSMKGENK